MQGEINQSYIMDNNDKIVNVDTDESKNNESDEAQSNFFKKFYYENRTIIKNLIKITMHILVGVYFGFATDHFIKSEKELTTTEANKAKGTRCEGKCGFQMCDGYGMLLILLILFYAGLFYFQIFKPIVKRLIKRNILKKYLGLKTINSRYLSIGIKVLILAAVAVFLFFETKSDQRRLIALLTPITFILAGYIFSVNRKAIKWNTVFAGILGQFILAVICLRWDVGRSVFQCVGEKVVAFLNYSEYGARFVFGNEMVEKKIFAFGILPVIYFFSFFISILYYLGTMQWALLKLGWILQQLLGTTVCESVNSAANIFLGMSESPLLIRPYINKLTNSEMHAIMTSGFATVSGTVLAAYVSFGASPSLLITSSVMAAPAALAISKLYYPETEQSQTQSTNIKLEASEDNSILDAASNGASNATVIILGIWANLVAFVAFIAFLNGIINWLGYLIGQDHIDFEWIFSKLFIPLSWILGVEWDECERVAEIIASKSIVNEFVAYEKLGKYLKEGLINYRSGAIATFAVCGFANPSSLGIMIGALSAMAPERRLTITSVAARAFWVGSIVCFMSASFATLLMPQSMIDELREKTVTDAPTGKSPFF